MPSTPWNDEESQHADFGDRRLSTRMSRLLDHLGKQPTASIPGALGGWSEIQAAYRFFDNDRVTMPKILATHAVATVARMRGHPVILGLQDTTFINFDGQRATTGLGPHSSDLEHGFLMHPLLAVTPDRQCLGLLHAETWARDAALGQRTKRAHKPIEAKESMRWLKGYDHLAELHDQLPATRLVCVGDRESDIYELFDHARTDHADWLIRAVRDRCIIDGPCLREFLAGTPSRGSYVIDVPAKGSLPARVATVDVRWGRVRLDPPYRPDRALSEIEVTAIEVHEPNPPAGIDALDWLLLTSLPCPDSLDEARTIISWYACRWQIEVFFRVLKSGCGIEQLQLQTRQRLEAAIAIYAIIAWRIMYALAVDRVCPETPATDIFTDEECTAAYALAKRKRPPRVTLHEVLRITASLGGYINKKGQGPPGPKTLWLGWQRLRDVVMGMDLMRKSSDIEGCVE
jgi:hypothetical protein